MGLFYFSKSDSQEDLCNAVIGNIKMFERHPSYMFALETAEMYITKLKVLAQQNIDDEAARNAAYYAKKATYPLCSNCGNFKFRPTDEIDITNDKLSNYCDEVSFEEFGKQLGRKFKDYDNAPSCSEFKWKTTE